ncbi:MAG: serine/threonine protein kinase [Pseudohongiellaceae bacterium]
MAVSELHPYEALTPDRVLDAIEGLGWQCDARIFPLNSYENRVYQIGIEDDQPLIAKFYRPGRWTAEQIQEEHDFAQELADLEIPVVAPLRLDGETSQYHFDDFTFAVFPRLRGRAPELDNMDDLLVMGRFLGRVHLCGRLQSFRYRHTLSAQRFGEDSREYLLRHDFIPGSLREAYETVSRDLLDVVHQRLADSAPFESIRLHGDCHPGNVLWQGEVPWFVDFDDAMAGPAVQDLWMLLSGDRDQRQGQLLELIEGYNEFHHFNPRELPLIEPLRTLRIMHYSAWLARRWDDPAFPMSFPWFNTERYWAEHVLELREQRAALDEPPLQLMW